MSEARMSPVEIAVRTDPGRDPDKQVNEDAAHYVETPHGLLAIVCDGMGGHAGGKEASELAVRTITEIVQAAPAATSPEVALKRAIEEANARVWSMPTAEAGFRPGSTVVAVLVHEGGAEVAHVGDSRVYLLHAGAISPLTRDHSMVEEMVARNLIRAEDAASHPDANKILRALGIAREVEVEVRPEPIAYVAGDVFVLCSDGLSDLVEPAEILEIAGSHPPAQAAGQLVDLANARGGHDNITAMVVRMTASAKPRERAERRGEAGRVPKTIPLTAAHAAPPSGAGPTGTLVAGPMTGGSARPEVGEPALSAGPQRIAAPTADRRGYPPKPVLVVGLVLALLAVGIVVAIVLVSTRKPHRTVPIVEPLPEAAAPRAVPEEGEEPAAVPEEVVVPAPTLEPPPRPRWRLPDGGAPDPCEAARRLRERGDTRTELLQRLDERCWASGGP